MSSRHCGLLAIRLPPNQENMVNIAGRSKGCSTCRRRRVKCDEKRPICNRCARCGFECSGTKEIAFIDSRKSVKTAKNGKHNGIGSTARDLRRTSSFPTPARLQGFEVQTYICYTRRYLLRGGPVDLALQDLQFDDLCTATDSTSDAYLFHLSILSLSTLFFGTQHRNTPITTNGYLLHGCALKKLNTALSDPQCQHRDDVLLSVIALILQEVFVPTGKKHFLKHTTGLEKLLELRGPGMLCSPESFFMFKSVRKLIILASMHKRAPSILAQEQWKDIPWDDESVEGRAEKFLFDVLADYTVLVSEHDRLVRNDIDDIDIIKQRDALTRRAEALLEKLYVWKAEWDSYAHLNPPTNLAITAPALPTTSTCLISQPATTTLMLYNTSLIYILQILSSPSLSPSTSNQSLYHSLQLSAAQEIHALLPHHLALKPFLDPGANTIAHLAVRSAVMVLERGEGRGEVDGGMREAEGEGALMRVMRGLGYGNGVGGWKGEGEGEVWARGLWGD